MKRKQVMALFAAGMLTFQMPITVMAETKINSVAYSGTEYDVADGKIDHGVEVNQGDQLTVNGNVSGVISGQGVSAKDSGTTVTVNGSVIGYYSGVMADDKATVNVNGDVTATANNGVFATDKASVNVTGDVKGQNVGVDAENKATVNVNGDVTGTDMAGVTANHSGTVVTVNGDVKGGVVGASASYGGRAEINGNVEGVNASGVQVNAEGSVSVKGNVTGGKSGVDASGEDTKVSVNGNVKGGDYGVSASSKGDVSVKGNVTGGQYGINARDEDTKVSVNGNVQGSSFGVRSKLNAEVNVNGNVTGTVMMGAEAYEGGQIKISGDVKGEYGGAQVMAGGKIAISGNLEGKKGGAYASGDGAFLYVEGNVKSEDGSAIIMQADSAIGSKGSTVEVLGVVDGKIVVQSQTGETVEDALGMMGNVIVNEIKTDGTKATDIVSVKGNDAISGALAQKVAEQKVFYIVNTEKIQNGTITITQTADMVGVMNADGTNMLDAYGNKLYAANQNKEITVKIVADKGYRVKSADGGKATLVLQADGTYLLTVPAGGGVDISALIEKIAEKESKKKSSKKTSGNGNAAVQAGTAQEIMYVPVTTQETEKTATIEATDLTEQIVNLYYGDIITAVMNSDLPVAPEVPVVYAAGIMDEQLVIIDQEAFTDDVEELKLNIARELVDEMELEELKDIQFVIDSHVITVETEKLALIQDQYGCKKIVIHVTKNEDGSLNNEVTIDITSMIELDMVTE